MAARFFGLAIEASYSPRGTSGTGNNCVNMVLGIGLNVQVDLALRKHCQTSAPPQTRNYKNFLVL